jgi:hypothetical protein
MNAVAVLEIHVELVATAVKAVSFSSPQTEVLSKMAHWD